LFGTGAYLYGHAAQGAAYTAIFIAAVAGLVWLTSRIWGQLSTQPTGAAIPVVDS
jgi:hypothetical protein